MIEHDTDVPGIAIVRSSRAWARTLHRYVVDHGGAVVRTRPLEERQAVEEEYDILIVDDISSFLSHRIVDELHRRGRKVLGVYDPEEFVPSETNQGRQRLLRLGVDGVIEAQASPEEFVRVIEDLAPEPSARHGYIDIRDTEPSEAEQIESQSPFETDLPGEIILQPRPSLSRRRGQITAVLGASGGCGVTEVAIELARSLGRRGERTVMVDGDEVAPSLAQRLNLALHPNLRTAVDVVEHSTGRLAECLTAIANNLEVLVGLPHPKDWVELRGSDMLNVIEDLARGRPQVVVNTAPYVEDLTTFCGADRFGISRAAISIANTVVIVCSPTPVGVTRLVDRVADLSETIDGKPVHVVVNRTSKGTFKRNEISREIERNFKAAGVHFLAEDPRVERAGWEGTLVPGGEFTKSLETTLTPAIPKANLVPPKAKAQARSSYASARTFRPVTETS